MSKEFILTMTSKGQFTLPIAARRLLGANKPGAKLQLTVHDGSVQADIKPLLTIDEIQALAQSFITPGTPPLQDPRAFYATRKPAK